MDDENIFDLDLLEVLDEPMLASQEEEIKYDEVRNQKSESYFMCKKVRIRRMTRDMLYNEMERPPKRIKIEDDKTNNNNNNIEFKSKIQQINKEITKLQEEKSETFPYRSLSSLQRLKDRHGKYHHWKKVYLTFYKIF